MTALFVTLIVVGCVVGWLFMAATAVRWADSAAKTTHWVYLEDEIGLDDIDRTMMWFLSLIGAPLALIGAGVFIFLRRDGKENSFLYRYTHPQEIAHAEKEERAKRLREQENEMRTLARKARREGRADEAKIFSDAADSIAASC